MGKSIRSKREKRLRAIRREIVEPFYEKKEVAKLAALDAALAAPKLPVRPSPLDSGTTSMDVSVSTTSRAMAAAMDLEMADDSKSEFLKPVAGIGKKSKRNFKVGKNKRRAKGKIRRKNSHI